jgi:hypothetical protein
MGSGVTIFVPGAQGFERSIGRTWFNSLCYPRRIIGVPMAQPPQVIQQVALTFSKSGSREPPKAANFVATSVLGELVILSFGYADPLTLQASVEGKPVLAEAPIFAQVALPRSVYAQSLRDSLLLIKQLPDRDTFFWQQLKAVFADTGAKP